MLTTLILITVIINYWKADMQESNAIEDNVKLIRVRFRQYFNRNSGSSEKCDNFQTNVVKIIRQFMTQFEHFTWKRIWTTHKTTFTSSFFATRTFCLSNSLLRSISCKKRHTPWKKVLDKHAIYSKPSTACCPTESVSSFLKAKKGISWFQYHLDVENAKIIQYGFTSHPTHNRSFPGQFLQAA